MKIICIGRNYSDHAKEMKADLPTEPLFFMKPDVALLKTIQTSIFLISHTIFTLNVNWF